MPRRHPSTELTVVINGNRIADIRTDEAGLPEAVTIDDGAARFLIPGLWDMHTQLAYTGDLTATLLVAYGLTSVRDPGGSLETITARRAGQR